MSWTTKEWLAVYENHEIRVVNTWFSGAKLYIDGDCCDTNTGLVATSTARPVLSGSIQLSDGQRHRVEVYVTSLLTTKAKICVNGRQIGGDIF